MLIDLVHGRYKKDLSTKYMTSLSLRQKLKPSIYGKMLDYFSQSEVELFCTSDMILLIKTVCILI